LIGRLNQTAADGVFPLSAFKPLSSDSTDRGRRIIRVKPFLKVQKFAFILMGKLTVFAKKKRKKRRKKSKYLI
jgi:hypothetical protein